jgi:hypothetical protein
MPKKQKHIRLQPSAQYGKPNGNVPLLRLSGKWLQEYGFHAGEMVNVTVREELLVIQPLKKPE